MKILQVIPTLDSGGAEHFMFELSNELIRLGHQVDILTLYNVSEDNPLRKALDKRIKIYTLHKKNGFEPRLFFSLRRFVKEHDYSVVHGHVGAIKYMTVASFLCRNTRFVATIHSEAKREAGKNIDKWTRQLMFSRNKCIPVTISNESELSFEEFYGRKTVMIFNGLSDYEKKRVVSLRDNEEQIVLLHPASCQPIKNQKLLLSAFNRLQKDNANVKLVWVGSKMYKELFKSLEPLMKGNVSYLGLVDNVRDYMIASDAVCLSSQMEGMPITIIEAFSVGCPVLCTPVGGCVNMITPGENGLMSDDLTEESYYIVLDSFVKMTKDERAKMSNASTASFAQYKIMKCAENYLKVYKGEMVGV